jgi:hypothetical protein
VNVESITPKLTRRIWTVISLVVIVPLGFYSKFYTGSGAHWVNNSLGGVFYEIFWCVLLFLFLPSNNPWFIALSVLVATCGLEFMQLWHPSFLSISREKIKNTADALISEEEARTIEERLRNLNCL